MQPLPDTSSPHPVQILPHLPPRATQTLWRFQWGAPWLLPGCSPVCECTTSAFDLSALSTRQTCNYSCYPCIYTSWLDNRPFYFSSTVTTLHTGHYELLRNSYRHLVSKQLKVCIPNFSSVVKSLLVVPPLWFNITPSRPVRIRQLGFPTRYSLKRTMPDSVLNHSWQCFSSSLGLFSFRNSVVSSQK